jgi:hypothetical protein
MSKVNIYKTGRNIDKNYNLTMNDNIKNVLHKIVPVYYSYRQQLHIYHLQTKSYARHKASDELLGELTEFIDRFIETYSGKYGRVVFNGPTNITIENLDDDHGMDLLDNMIKYLLNDLPKYLDPKIDSDLLNLRDDIVGKINQTRYLYTLQ